MLLVVGVVGVDGVVVPPVFEFDTVTTMFCTDVAPMFLFVAVMRHVWFALIWRVVSTLVVNEPLDGTASRATLLLVVMSTTETLVHAEPTVPLTVTVWFADGEVITKLVERLAALAVEAVSNASLTLPPPQAVSRMLVATAAAIRLAFGALNRRAEVWVRVFIQVVGCTDIDVCVSEEGVFRSVGGNGSETGPAIPRNPAGGFPESASFGFRIKRPGGLAGSSNTNVR